MAALFQLIRSQRKTARITRALAPALLAFALLAAPAALAQSAYVPAGVDPQKYAQFASNIEKMIELQDPTHSKWALENTKEMMQLLEENAKLGLKLSRDEAAIRVQNLLVENMQEHCRILSLASNPNAVLLRVGKTPESAAFGGLNTAKVSDFDQTIVGAGAEEVRVAHTAIASEHFGPGFMDMTLSNLALADGTIAAWKLEDIRKAYGTALLDPEMHRTYSGLQFVEDYILSVGEISTLDPSGTRLITVNLETFKKDKQAFVDYANKLFEKAGASIRFGQREKGFCLGLMTDISNQMWMNVGKELLLCKGGACAPENHVLKYCERYTAQMKEVLGVDLAQDAAYEKVRDLIETCHSDPTQWAALEQAAHEFEQRVWNIAAERQNAAYADAAAKGLTARMKAILLDTEGAVQNARLMKARASRPMEAALGTLAEDAGQSLGSSPLVHSAETAAGAEAAGSEAGASAAAVEHAAPPPPPEMPLGELGTLGHEASGNVDKHPPFAEPAFVAGAAAREAVMDRPSMRAFLKKHRTAVFLQVGCSLYAMKDAFEAQAEGDPNAVWNEAKNQLMDGLLYTGVPILLDYARSSLVTSALGWGPCVIGLAELGATSYREYVHERLTEQWVEPRISARLAGVLPDGSRVDAPDVLSELGAPKADSDFVAPFQYVDGVFKDGTLRVRHQQNGTIVIEEIDPALAVREREYVALNTGGATSFGALGQLPPNPVKRSWSYTPGELVAEKRLNRAFEAMRREWRASHPSIGPRDSLLDLRKLADPWHLDFALEFQHPVDTQEILYYFKRYRDAVIKSQVGFNDATAVFRQAPNGFQLEVELGDAVTRRFLEEMARRAAEADAAHDVYEKMGPLALKTVLDAGQPLHVEGRDLTRAEIEQRIADLRALALQRADAANPIWLEWLSEHWKRPELGIPDLRNTEVSVLSFEAQPNPDLSMGEGAYRLLLKYQLNKKPDGVISFYIITEGDTSEARSSSSLLGDPANDRDPNAPGIRTEAFGVGADTYRGKDKRVYIRIESEEWDPVKKKDRARMLARTASVTIPGSRTQWVFERLVQTSGRHSFDRKLTDDDCHLQVLLADRGVSIHGHVNGEQGSWSDEALRIGPLPATIVNFDTSGFFVESHSSYRSFVPDWDREKQEHNCDRFMLSWWQDGLGECKGGCGWVSDSKESSDSCKVYAPPAARYDHDRALGLAKLSGPKPEKFEGEHGEQYSELDLFDRSDYFNIPERLHLIARVGLNAPDTSKIQELRFDWYYRLAKPGEILPTMAPGAMWAPSLASAAAGGSSGSAPSGGENPWQHSLEGTHVVGGDGSGRAPSPASEMNAVSGSGWQVLLAQARAASDGEATLASATPWEAPAVQAAMEEWLHAAKPPVEEGTSWHYTEWGVMENGVGVKAVHPDNQGMERHHYLWERCRRLTSINHCTLGEFIRLRLTGGSTDGCRGKSAAAHPAPARALASAPTATGPARPLSSGDPAPAFEASTLDGKRTIRLGDLRGKTVIFSLWNPAGPTDRAQYGYLAEGLGAYREIAVLSAAPGYARDLKTVRTAIATMPKGVEELVPDSTVIAPYMKGVMATPTTYVIDAKGVVRGVYTGTLKGNWKADNAIREVAGVNRR